MGYDPQSASVRVPHHDPVALYDFCSLKSSFILLFLPQATIAKMSAQGQVTLDAAVERMMERAAAASETASTQATAAAEASAAAEAKAIAEANASAEAQAAVVSQAAAVAQAAAETKVSADAKSTVSVQDAVGSHDAVVESGVASPSFSEGNLLDL